MAGQTGVGLVSVVCFLLGVLGVALTLLGFSVLFGVLGVALLLLSAVIGSVKP